MATVTRVDTITHVDQLYAMGIGSIVVCADGIAAQKYQHGWYRAEADPDSWSSSALLDNSITLAVVRWIPKTNRRAIR